MTESKTLKGPYVDGAAINTKSETLFLCVECANDRDDVEEEDAIMYDDMPDMDTLRCDDCGELFRDYDGD